MKPKYIFREERHAVEPVRCDDGMTLEIDGHEVEARIERHNSHHADLIIDGMQYEIFTAQDGDRIYIHANGRAWMVEAVNEFRDVAGDAADDGSTINAPMPGTVLELNVREGDTVESGQSIILIESMKLQTEIKSPVEGKVTRINFEPGQSFDKGAILVELEPDEQAS